MCVLCRELGPDGDAPAVEEEPKQFTLDEWRAQRANRQKPQYNLRKAGEGEDPTQWKKMYELSKKKEGEEEESDDEVIHCRWDTGVLCACIDRAMFSYHPGI